MRSWENIYFFSLCYIVPNWPLLEHFSGLRKKLFYNDLFISLYIYIYIYIYIYDIYPTAPLRQDMTQGQFFKRSLTGLNSEFSFS